MKTDTRCQFSLGNQLRSETTLEFNLQLICTISAAEIFDIHILKRNLCVKFAFFFNASVSCNLFEIKQYLIEIHLSGNKK